MAINNRLKELLNIRHITQSDFADSVKISKSTLSNIINNKQNATLETAIDITRLLDLKVEDVFIKQRSEDEAIIDFGKLVERSNKLYELYENKKLTREEIVLMYKAFIEYYVKEYNPIFLNKCFEAIGEENMNEIFENVVCDCE